MRFNVPPVGMSAPNKVDRRLNLVEVTSRNKVEIGSVFSIWLLLSQKCFHFAVETELCYCILRGVYEELNYTLYCPLVLDNLQD